ncbi:hypothetical protein GGR57DRAFT_17929 [Xylariaceae sp. FL1272]|nr:hypothetical protein GGR57DRAFT_17929 [Xylariaceae sp. FL1272]
MLCKISLSSHLGLIRAISIWLLRYHISMAPSVASTVVSLATLGGLEPTLTYHKCGIARSTSRFPLVSCWMSRCCLTNPNLAAFLVVSKPKLKAASPTASNRPSISCPSSTRLRPQLFLTTRLWRLVPS